MKKLQLCLVAVILIGWIGCQQKGPVQEAGERVDEIVDNVKDGDSPFKHKGPMEKLGESVDDSIKNAEEKN